MGFIQSSKVTRSCHLMYFYVQQGETKSRHKAQALTAIGLPVPENLSKTENGGYGSS